VRFKRGETVVYPPVGVGKITTIEKKKIAGQNIACYVITIPGKNLTVMIPIHNAAKVGLRRVITAKEAERVCAILQQKMDKMPARWTKRYSFHREKIQTGSIYEIAAVLKNLTHLQQTRHLSLHETRMLERIRELIVREIAYSKHIGMTQAEKLIARCCCRS
jgi:CarD family transcriptional regulator